MLPHASPDQLPHDWHLELRCPHWLEQGHLNWEGPNYLHSAQWRGIVSPGASEIGSGVSLPASACHNRHAPCDLIEFLRMQKRSFFRWILPAILCLLVGFLALAWAITSESSLPVSLVSLFSPGLKIAELIMPAAHESLAWTFGWFLRIAIGVNAIFYYAIFALLAYLIDRRHSHKS